MPTEEERRSRQIYRKGDIDIDGRDYAIDVFEGELPSLSEGDRYIVKDRAGIYNLALIKKEDSDDKKCDRDHHYCHKHGRCERDDHDCDDKGGGGDGHDPDLDRKILESLNRIQSDIEGKDLERDVDKTLSTVLTNQNLINRIISLLTNIPPPPPIPIPPSPSPPPPSPSPSPPPPPGPNPPPPAPKEQSHTRVIIQGEVDVPHDETTEENKPEDSTMEDHIARQVVEHMKGNNPSFKITKVLVARGIGPVKTPW